MKAQQAINTVDSVYKDLNDESNFSSKELEALKIVLESAKEFHTQFMWDIEKELDGRDNINILTQRSNFYSSKMAKKFGVEDGNNGFILGDIIEVDDEVLNFEYWIAVDESTLREVQDTVTFTEEDADVVRNWILHLAVHGYFVNWGESDRKTYEKLTGESVPSLTYEGENE